MEPLLKRKNVYDRIKSLSYQGKTYLRNDLLSKHTQWKIHGYQQDRPISVAFFGTESIAEDICRILLDSVQNMTAGKTYSYRHSLKKFKSLPAYSYDIAVMEHPYLKLHSNQPSLWMQTNLDTVVAPGDCFEEFLRSKMTKRMRTSVRKALRGDYKIVLEKQSDSLGSFYEDLLIPYTKAIHGEDSHIPSMEELMNKKKKLILLRLLQGEKTLAGSLLLENHDRSNLRIWRHGISTAVLSNKPLRGNISRCLDAHAINYACEHSISQVSFGLVPPLADHGLVTNKKAWGCQLVPIPFFPYCEIKSSKRSEAWMQTEQSIVFMDPSKHTLMQSTCDDGKVF